MKPKISVIMPVYNAEKYLEESMTSILNQSFKNFEFLIMDDGSKDKSAAILKKYAQKDKRIRLFHQKNRGIAKSLNTLIDKANTDIIARMDADDIAHLERFTIQYTYLQKHPKTALLGSFGELFRENKILGANTAFAEDFMNRWFLSLFPPFLHSSVIFRKNAFIKAGKYRKKYEPAEDYDLWIRIKRFGKIENIPQILTKMRITPESISGTNWRKQIIVRDQLGLMNLEDIYKHDEIPKVQKIQKTLSKVFLSNSAASGRNKSGFNARKKYVIGKICCRTACFLIQKNEYQIALQFLKFALQLDKKRLLDALPNMILGKFGLAYLISVDYSPHIKKLTAKIHWFRHFN